MTHSIKEGRGERDLHKHIHKLEEFTSQLWIVGSDEVVQSYNRWLRRCRQNEEPNDGGTGLVKMAEILIEMRRDLGYKTSAIEPIDILTTFVKDIDEHVC